MFYNIGVTKIIMHIDLNAFFATAETLRDPSTKGKPLAVGGHGPRSVISTANYEARKCGVHSAMPVGQALRLCPDLILKKPDFHYYEILSNSFFGYLTQYAPIIERASIDEGYVDMTKRLANDPNPLKTLQGLQDGLLKELGLPCSIGIGPCKFLAKMASDMKKPLGITVLRRKDLETKLYPLPISSFFGIGKKTAPRLESLGIKTIGDLKAATDRDDPALQDMFGKYYDSVKRHVNGYGDDVVVTERPDPKSIGRSHTFAQDTNDYEEIREVLSSMCERICSEARREKKAGTTVDVIVRDPDFVTHSKSQTVKEPIDEAAALFDVGWAIYRANFLGRQIRLVGITLQNLMDPRNEDVQMSLWNYEEYEKKDETRLLIAEMNRKMSKKYDKDLLMRGSEAKKHDDR